MSFRLPTSPVVSPIVALILTTALTPACRSEQAAAPVPDSAESKVASPAQEAEASAPAAEQAAAAADEPAVDERGWPRVTTYGALRTINLEGKIEPVVRLRDAARQGSDAAPNFGLGALGNLRGEVTLFDGEFHLAIAGDHGQVVYETRSVEELGDEHDATIFFATRVDSWDDVPLDVLPDSAGLDYEGLEAFFEGLVAERDLPRDRAIPFRIEGQAEEIAWHVVDSRRFPDGGTSCEERRESSIKEFARVGRVELFGYYSTVHTSVIVDHTTNVHVHAVLEDGRSGHVDGFKIGKDAVVKIPTLP